MNSMVTARLLAFTSGLSICIFEACHAQPLPQTVQINLGNEAGGFGDEPLKALASAATQNVKSKFIRMNWECNAFSLSSSVTALYDRHRKTLNYYYSSGHSMGGKPTETVYAHYLYIGVTDNLIRQAALFLRVPGPYPDAVRTAPTYAKSGTPGSYCDALLTFGCHRKKLP